MRRPAFATDSTGMPTLPSTHVRIHEETLRCRRPSDAASRSCTWPLQDRWHIRRTRLARRLRLPAWRTIAPFPMYVPGARPLRTPSLISDGRERSRVGEVYKHEASSVREVLLSL